MLSEPSKDRQSWEENLKAVDSSHFMEDEDNMSKRAYSRETLNRYPVCSAGTSAFILLRLVSMSAVESN